MAPYDQTYVQLPRLGALQRGSLFLQKHFRWSTFLIALLLCLGFMGAKQAALQVMGIKVTTHLGQLEKVGNKSVYFYGDYTAQVNTLLQTGSLVNEEGHFENRYTPVYPYLLYATHRLARWLDIPVPVGVMLLTALLIGLSAVLLANISFLFFPNRLQALLAGLLFSSHPYVLQGLTKTMSVTPFMVFLYLALFLFFDQLIRKNAPPVQRLFLAGVALGLAMLTRPIALFLPLVLSFLYLVFAPSSDRWLRRLLPAIALIGGAVVMVVPWQALNYAHGQVVLLSSDRVYSIIDGVWFTGHPHKNDLDLPAPVLALSQRLASSGVRSKKEFFGLVFEELKKDPGPVWQLYTIKAGRSWYGSFGQQSGKEKIKLGISLLYLLLAAIGSFRLGWSDPRHRLLLVTIGLVLLYFWAMTVLVVSMVRYMIPVFGLLGLLIAAIPFGDPQRIGGNASPRTARG